MPVKFPKHATIERIFERLIREAKNASADEKAHVRTILRRAFGGKKLQPKRRVN